MDTLVSQRGEINLGKAIDIAIYMPIMTFTEWLTVIQRKSFIWGTYPNYSKPQAGLTMSRFHDGTITLKS